MDKKEAVRLFIKRNSGMFNQDPFPWQVYKKAKHIFFIEEAKIPGPKDSEIASEIIEGMITNLQIATEEKLEKILSLPFFNDKIQNKQYYFERLAVRSRQATPILDIKSLEKAEVAKKLREELKEELHQEFIEEKESEIRKWEERISAKEEEYLSSPSILDGDDYPIPEIPTEESTEKVYLPWWERLGLKRDPFRELEGLSRIDRALYGKIVHKTDIFIKYESMITNSFFDLFRNTVVYGQFGSGKTTFFDYMICTLEENKVLSLYVQLGGEFEVRELIFDFRKKVSMDLKRLYAIFVGENPPKDSIDDEQTIADLMKRLTFKGARGFVIFIDDLHKGDFDKAMRFVSYLQVLAAGLRRATDLNIGFFIAGSKSGNRKLTTTHRCRVPLIDRNSCHRLR